MDEERFNMSLRRLLKQFGVTAQREVEKAVDTARQAGAVRDGQSLRARASMVVEGLPGEVVVEGPIEL